MSDSEQSTVRTFNFYQFSPTEEEPEYSDEARNIIFHDFNDECDLIDSEPEEPEDPTIADAEALQKTLEEQFRKIEEAHKEESKIISDANSRAEMILQEAEKEAEEIKKKAHADGLNDGYNDGYNKAYETNKAKLEKETMDYLLELRDLIDDYSTVKDKLIVQNIDELKDVTIAIAEKVVQVSLKTSGEIIKKMIVSATEKLRFKEWARIYIARSESSLIIEGNSDFLRSLSHVSENIKVIAMENAAPGTCIIELPDQVIDASASTQLENIRNAMKSVDINGGNGIV